ncbi:S-protein homolog 74-like [Momordica charantia]|uniref:S-protein homolog n=1 Tax=Momordica charantia TaxID=3673 RepID=A0A6J1DNS4_MOMCH|nr:S-protein homolog 74-like [Momordica charantia]
MDPTGRHVIVLLVWSALVVAAAADQKQLYPVVEVQHVDHSSTRFLIHVANGLSGDICYVSCKSKDTNIGGHFLDLGANIGWHFEPNFWGTTLFWCFASKSGAKASFDVFWVEKRSSWLRERCGGDETLTCIWIVKDDGIYIRNLTQNVDELIHKWNE